MTDALESNKALVRRLYEEGFNEGNLGVVDELVAPDVVTHDPIILDAPTGPDSIRGGIEMIRRAFPDSASRCSTSSPRMTVWRRSCR
jgi:SnoaL-like polyketide cyclase